MVDLSTDFRCGGEVIKLDLEVPPLARQVLARLFDITGAKELCIAGGFARGLYMQRFLGLAPQMNDVDVFADLSRERFDAVRDRLEKELGKPVRYHVGWFDKEKNPRGLVEFELPHSLRKRYAGVESVQLNFGPSHPWANPYKYVARANVGMNQIAITQDGEAIASQSFMSDMTNKTMTLNPDRPWTVYDWRRTNRSLKRMQTERPEFQGWKIIATPEPRQPITGTFWETQKSFFPEP